MADATEMWMLLPSQLSLSYPQGPHRGQHKEVASMHLPFLHTGRPPFVFPGPSSPAFSSPYEKNHLASLQHQQRWVMGLKAPASGVL